MSQIDPNAQTPSVETPIKPGPGRKPLGERALTNAERQARFKQAKRDAEAKRLQEEAEARAAAAETARKQEERRTLMRRVLGAEIRDLAGIRAFTTYLSKGHDGYDALIGMTDADHEDLRQYAYRIAEAMERGDRRLP